LGFYLSVPFIALQKKFPEIFGILKTLFDKTMQASIFQEIIFIGAFMYGPPEIS
jgi:hypothetical protein